MKLSAVLLTAVFAITTSVNANPLEPRIVACPAIVVRKPPVVAVSSGTPVNGLELSNQGGIASLTTAGLESGWNFGNGGLGYPWCPTSSWLNIVDSVRPWKPLVWGSPQSTTTWKAGYYTYLTANATKTYGDSDTFLACKPLAISAADFAKAPKWTLFLLTNSTLPTASDETLASVNVTSCVKTKLFIESLSDDGVLPIHKASREQFPNPLAECLAGLAKGDAQSIMKSSAVLLPTLFAITTSVNANPVSPRVVYCPAVIMPTPPVVAVSSGTAVDGLELSNQGGLATLTKAGLGSGWNFGNGGLGYPWCPTSSWLNIADSVRPWKPLVWGSSQSTTTWKAGYSKYLTANATKTYGDTDTFLACKPSAISATDFAKAPKWTLFLLTSSTLPTASDEALVNVNITSCVKTKLFIESGANTV
ncbi:hypothetical protein FRB90_003738 [Tulasnella sp. 427]|nr:hypothetical protein FRB90_003738 [Tulasnella sp. 427]